MHDLIDKTPRLFRVVNIDTAEVFTTFAKSSDEAVSSLPLGPSDTFTIEEVMATLPDGSQHNIFQLRHVPAACSGTFFRTVNCNSLKVGKTVWLKNKGDYDPSTRKYCCIAAEDICKSREFKPGQWVITTFTY
jgi:hypothetical protein